MLYRGGLSCIVHVLVCILLYSFFWYLSCEGAAGGNGAFGPRIIGCDIFLFIATLPIVAVGSFISFFVIPTELLTFLFARRVD